MEKVNHIQNPEILEKLFDIKARRALYLAAFISGAIGARVTISELWPGDYIFIYLFWNEMNLDEVMSVKLKIRRWIFEKQEEEYIKIILKMIKKARRKKREEVNGKRTVTNYG